MKIAHVCQYFKPAICGVGSVVYELARRQVQLGHEVYVFTSDYDKHNRITQKEIIIDGIKVVRNTYWLKLSKFATLWPAVFPKLLQHKFDIIHSHSFGHPHVLLAGLAAKLSGAKHIHSTHYPWTALRSNLAKRLMSKYYYAYSPIFNLITDRILLLAKSEQPFLKKYKIHCKMNVLPNGASSEYFKLGHNPPTKQKIKSVLFVGRLCPTKGVDLLAQAAVEICSKRKDIVFIFAGPDEGLKDKIESIIKGCDKIKLMGRVTEAEKMDLLKNCYMFVLPSRREGLPLVLIEAMAAGKPIVTSGVDGIASVAKDKINCLLFNKNDASDLGAKIELLLDNPKLANKLAQNNRKKAMQYDWDIIAEELQNIYGDKNEEIS